MTESKNIEKAKKSGLCGNCPVKLGFPFCWICVFAAIIAVHFVGNFLV
ncbi:MAG: hypothetical protein JSW61_07980 [Candidatus Thorarchaeota archaeon]|nr:MAG: hypothetical protein JSW61_07980 [Candidatus Thorarchaeota archaeon]